MSEEPKQIETAQCAELKPITERDLRRLLRYWQRRLRLADWQCTIRFAKQHEFDDEEGQGQNDVNLHARTSDILILDPSDYDPANYGGRPQDIEDTVVHELNHLHLAHWKPKNGAEEVAMEQAIESISGALVSLKRRTKTTA